MGRVKKESIKKQYRDGCSSFDLIDEMDQVLHLQESTFPNQSIRIVDAPCGWGKTSWAFKSMKKHIDCGRKVIFVTPYLSEIDRCADELSGLITTPIDKVHSHSDHLEEIDYLCMSMTKKNQVKELIRHGESIATTHSLFRRFDVEMKCLIEKQGYILFLDEVANVIEQINYKKNTLPILVKNNMIEVDERTLEVKWIGDTEDIQINGLSEVQADLMGSRVTLVRDSALIWTIPVTIFTCFNKVYVLTYMFDFQQQAYYYKLHGVGVEKYTVESLNNKYQLVKWEERNRMLMSDYKAKLRERINIYSGKLNEIGQSKNGWIEFPYKDKTLSTSWYRRNENRGQMRKNLHNYFSNVMNAGKDNRLWTMKKYGIGKKLEGATKEIAGTRYNRQFLAMNTRGSNDYADVENMAYLQNRFLNPIEKAYFQDVHGVCVNEELWALSEMIQWLWRGCIRNDDFMNVYIPSIRMRTLFEKWLETDMI